MASFDDYDGGYRLHLFSIDGSGKSEYGPADSPIGCDAALTLFAEYVVPVSEDTVAKVAFFDRDKTAKGALSWPFPEERDRYNAWRAIALLADPLETVILRDRELLWYSLAEQREVNRIPNCLSEEFYGCYCDYGLSLHPNFVLIHPLPQFGCHFEGGQEVPKHPRDAVMVDRVNGKIWEAHDLLTTTVVGSRVLVSYVDGRIEVLDAEGEVMHARDPLPGYYTIGGVIQGDVLTIGHLDGAQSRVVFEDHLLPR